MKRTALTLIAIASSSIGVSAHAGGFTLATQAQILGLLVQRVDVPTDVKADILAIVGGQSYENRVSLTGDTSCFTPTPGHGSDITCEFIVGKDDTTDGDTGWGSEYKITTRANSNGTKIRSVKIEPFAG